MKSENPNGYESVVNCPHCGSDEVYTPTWVRILHDRNRPAGTGGGRLELLFWDPQVTDLATGDPLPNRCTACGEYISNIELAPQLFGDEEEAQQQLSPSE